jgi:hypothetical protein
MSDSLYLSRDGYGIRLTLEGYQFPDTTTGWDANWLMILIDADTAAGKLSKSDACMLTSDVLTLRGWFSEVSHAANGFGSGMASPEALRFMEPALEFFSNAQVVGLRFHTDFSYRVENAPADLIRPPHLIEQPLENVDFPQVLAILDRWARQCPMRAWK